MVVRFLSMGMGSCVSMILLHERSLLQVYRVRHKLKLYREKQYTKLAEGRQRKELSPATETAGGLGTQKDGTASSEIASFQS